MSAPLRFIRRNGRVIPIRAPGGDGSTASKVGSKLGKAAKATRAAVSTGVAAATGISKLRKQENKAPFQVNHKLDLTGLGLSIASGAIAAATFGTPKGLAAGHAIAKVIDIGGISANAASVAGKGQAKERAKQGIKQEARNFVVGNAVFAAGIIGSKTNRAAAVNYAKKGAEYASKIVAFGRKALRVV